MNETNQHKDMILSLQHFFECSCFNHMLDNEQTSFFNWQSCWMHAHAHTNWLHYEYACRHQYKKLTSQQILHTFIYTHLRGSSAQQQQQHCSWNVINKLSGWTKDSNLKKKINFMWQQHSRWSWLLNRILSRSFLHILCTMLILLVFLFCFWFGTYSHGHLFFHIPAAFFCKL